MGLGNLTRSLFWRAWQIQSLHRAAVMKSWLSCRSVSSHSNNSVTEGPTVQDFNPRVCVCVCTLWLCCNWPHIVGSLVFQQVSHFSHDDSLNLPMKADHVFLFADMFGLFEWQQPSGLSVRASVCFILFYFNPNKLAVFWCRWIEFHFMTRTVKCWQETSSAVNLERSDVLTECSHCIQVLNDPLLFLLHVPLGTSWACSNDCWWTGPVYLCLNITAKLWAYKL